MSKFKQNTQVIYGGLVATVLTTDESIGMVKIAWLDEDGNAEFKEWVAQDDIEPVYIKNEESSETPTETIRGGILLEAKGLIEGDRNVTYGTPTENFTNIAGMWNILFKHKLTEEFTPADVAQAMIALKQCRMITDQKKRDSWVDLAGYAACGYEAITVLDSQD